MASLHNQLVSICLGSATFSGLIAYLLFRPFRWRQFVGHLPLFLVSGGALLFIAVATLPEATPHLSARFLGHSLNDMVTQRLSGGVTMTENWVTFWGESVVTAFRYVILASAIWAIANLFRRDAVWSNVLTLMLSLGWAFIYLWASVARFPF
jgi:hypothetical protein